VAVVFVAATTFHCRLVCEWKGRVTADESTLSRLVLVVQWFAAAV